MVAVFTPMVLTPLARSPHTAQLSAGAVLFLAIGLRMFVFVAWLAVHGKTMTA